MEWVQPNNEIIADISSIQLHKEKQLHRMLVCLIKSVFAALL